MNKSKAKIASKSLLITLLLLFSTIAFIGMPMSEASPGLPITPQYDFELNSVYGSVNEVAGWIKSPDELHGAYVAHLKSDHTDFAEYAYVNVYPDLVTPITLDTLLTVGIPEFDYYLTMKHAKDIAPELMLLFTWVDYTPAVGKGWVQICLCPRGQPPISYHYTVDPEVWHTATADGTIFSVAYGKETDGTPIAIDEPSKELTDLITDVKALDPSAGDWELTRVSPLTGWLPPTAVSEAYIDNVKVVDGEEEVIYDLEPQNLIAGESYGFSWQPRYVGATLLDIAIAEPVNLLYTPEGEAHIDLTEDTSSEGVVHFYSVTPEYAGNWTLSDLISVPAPMMDEDGLVKLSMTPGPKVDTYFLVQPVEDLTVAVSPSAVDVDTGTVALTVTVTNATGPVPGAYVNVEFWDYEAKHFDTVDTHLLRTYVTQTASNGKAMFDIEVPEVAGTIYVLAGTDVGPLDADPDGDYYEHWGYTTIPVAPEPFLDITVTPDSYLKGIPLDLLIELGNKDATKDILEASDTANAVNITLEGDDMTGTTTLALQDEFTVDYIRYYEATTDVWEIDNAGDLDFTDAEIVVIVGHTTGISFGTTVEAGLTITDFTSTEAGTITVTACSDIGGVSTLDSIALPGAPDGGADYTETAPETITVTTPAALNIVKVTTTPPILKVEFAGLPDGSTFQAISTATTIQLKVYDAEGHEFKDTGDYVLTDADFTLTGVKFAKDPEISYVEGRWVITIYPLESGNITVTVTHDTAVGSAEYKNYGLKASVTPAQFTNTTAYYDVNVTLTTFEGLPISTAKVQLQQKDAVLTQHLTTGDVPAYLEGVRPGDPSGLYRFFNVTAIQVGTEWDDAIQVVAGLSLTAAEVVGDYTQVGDNFGGEMIPVIYDVLNVTLDRYNVTALIDQDVVVTVTEDTTPIVDASVYADGCGYDNELVGTTGADGTVAFAFDGNIAGIIPGTMTIRAVTAELTKTGSTMLTVLSPDFALYNLTVNDHTTTVVTAGLDAYIYNATVLDGDGNIVLTTSDVITVATDTEVGLFFNATSNQTGLVTDGKPVDAEYLLLATSEGYVLTKILKASTCTADYAPYDIFEFKVCDESTGTYPSTEPDGNLMSVYNLTISPPIVSNTTYTGTWITYTGYVGQTGTFYVKVEDADGVVVEGAKVAIWSTTTELASGVTDAAGEVTLAWMPLTTGTYDIRLNDVLNIGTITVVPYVAPQLVITYTPEIVYLDSTVTVTVTADGTPIMGASVTIVDPDGISTSRTTTIAGTCTFTADKVGYWSVSASKTGYTDAEPVSIEVLAGVPPPLPAEVSGEETLDSTGAPKTSFALGETVLVSAKVTNIGIESQPMLIVVQLMDPDLRALAPTYIIVTLDPGDSLTPSLGFIIPPTGYAIGEWTAKIMVLDTWPALGGVPIAEPVTVTFTVTS